MSEKKGVVVHIFDLFIIVGSVVGAVYYLHHQLDRIEIRMQAQERRIDDLYLKMIDVMKESYEQRNTAKHS